MSGHFQPQRPGIFAEIRTTPVHDAIVEVHSHHAMRAYFSATDARDETGRRVYGVLGRLAGPHPEIALRVVSGCNPLVVGPVPFSEVFAADLDDYRDVNYSTEPPRPSASIGAAVRSAPYVRALARQTYQAHLLFEIAEDTAAIRQVLEAIALSPDVIPDSGFPQ